MPSSAVVSDSRLLVDADAERLKDPRLLLVRRGPAHRRREGRHEVVADPEGLGNATTHDFAGQLAGPRLLGQLTEESRQLLFVLVREDVGRRLAPLARIHAHVEGGPVPIR